jgi:hypothetical protein
MLSLGLSNLYVSTRSQPKSKFSGAPRDAAAFQQNAFSASALATWALRLAVTTPWGRPLLHYRRGVNYAVPGAEKTTAGDRRSYGGLGGTGYRTPPTLYTRLSKDEASGISRIFRKIGPDRFTRARLELPASEVARGRLTHADYPSVPATRERRYFSIALRNTSKITAVDQPNIRTPFIAVMGPSSSQSRSGVTSP